MTRCTRNFSHTGNPTCDAVSNRSKLAVDPVGTPLKATLLSVVLLALTTTPAFAQSSGGEPCPSYLPPEDATDATQLSLRGVACFENGEYLKALIYYRKAYSISKSAVLRGGIGRSLQELGQPDLARQYYEDYLAVASSSTDGYSKIQQRLDDVRETLKTTTSEVTITSSPGDAEVFVVLDGEYWEPLGTTPVKLRMSEGQHRLIFRKSDYQTREQVVDVSASDATTEVEAELVSQDATFNVADRQWRQRGAYLMLASIPAFAASAAFFVIGEDRLDEADALRGFNTAEEANDLRDSGYAYRTAGLVTAALGGAALASGLVFYIVGLEDDATIAIMPSVGPRQIGVLGRF